RNYVANLPVGSRKVSLPCYGSPGQRQIRVAYFSGDFRIHPVALQVAELIERHDRSRFDILGISFGPDDNSDIRRRLSRAFDRFYDVTYKGDREVAQLVEDLGIDILVDLVGHTTLSRAGVLACRPAPIQVNYLGYSGTIGGEFIDYVIADAVTVPFDQ